MEGEGRGKVARQGHYRPRRLCSFERGRISGDTSPGRETLMAITKSIRTLQRRLDHLLTEIKGAKATDNRYSYMVEEAAALDKALQLMEAERLSIHERRAKCAAIQPS